MYKREREEYEWERNECAYLEDAVWQVVESDTFAD
jgi:hypothetical protein